MCNTVVGFYLNIFLLEVAIVSCLATTINYTLLYVCTAIASLSKYICGARNIVCAVTIVITPLLTYM